MKEKRRSRKRFSRDELHLVPVSARRNKVGIDDFARVPPPGYSGSPEPFLPRILAGKDFTAVIDAIVNARKRGRPVIAALGGHVIKCGLAPQLIALAEKGYVTSFAMNGAAAIHDFEIALWGGTSEDVEQTLPGGSFGVTDETGAMFNAAVNEGYGGGKGMGESIAEFLRREECPHGSYSILHQSIPQCGKGGFPVTVHVAIGTDFIHLHPAAKGEALGATSFMDFLSFCEAICDLARGGVIVNFGSAVLLPEVFLKALTAATASGVNVGDFTSANFDMIKHYRPFQNFVVRPGLLGAKAYHITGHHEILIPMLALSLMARNREGEGAESE